MTAFVDVPHAGVRRLRRSGTGDAVVAGGKWALRRIGMATSSMRPGPELIVVGAKRGGTTSLWQYLSDHPGVMPLFPRAQKIKGTYYFDENFERSASWYFSHFPTRAARSRLERELGYPPVAVEASPYYLYHPWAPSRARALLADTHILVLLRDPVERAYSHWKERRNHSEDLPFVEALAAEPARTAGEEARILADPSYVSFAHRHQSYVAQGIYAPMLERWMAAYPPEQLLIVAAEEFYADPQRLLDELCGRLGLPTTPIERPQTHNAEPSDAMDPQVRVWLEARFAPEIEWLEQLLGRPMPWGGR